MVSIEWRLLTHRDSGAIMPNSLCSGAGAMLQEWNGALSVDAMLGRVLAAVWSLERYSILVDSLGLHINATGRGTNLLKLVIQTN